MNIPELMKKDMQADLEYLARLLAESHPDPFAGAGGAVNFYRLVDEINRILPDHLGTTDYLRLHFSLSLSMLLYLGYRSKRQGPWRYVRRIGSSPSQWHVSPARRELCLGLSQTDGASVPKNGAWST